MRSLQEKKQCYSTVILHGVVRCRVRGLDLCGVIGAKETKGGWGGMNYKATLADERVGRHNHGC